MRPERFPLGAAATIEELESAPYDLLARLREREPVSWLPAIGGWLVTRRDLALAAMRDAGAFTVQDPRFTTARVVGPSMLSLDGPEHDRHRAPFVAPLRLGAVRERLADAVREVAALLLDALEPAGEAELRRGFARPLAAAVVTRALGLSHADVDAVLGYYDAIVGAVSDLSAGRPARPEAAEAMRALADALRPDVPTGDLAEAEYVSDAAVMLFGGIETTEGMIANAIVHLLAHGARDARLEDVVEESLRLEPRRRPSTATRRPTPRSAARRSRPATSCGSRSPPPIATRRRSRSPTASTPGARTRGATSHSRAARTSAWGCTSRGWRRTRRSSCCSGACRGCAWTRSGRRRSGGSSSASPRSSG